MTKTLPALPPPETSVGDAPLQKRLTSLLEELRQTAKRAGVSDNSPMGPLLNAFILVLEWLGACLAELRVITVDYGLQALQRLQAVRAADEAATGHVKTQIEAAKVRVLDDFRHELAWDIDKVTAGRVRAEVCKISLIAAFVLVASGAASGVIGYRWGREVGKMDIHETETRLEAAFKRGAAAAASWANLMEWNDIDAVLEACRARRLSEIENGRLFCRAPLWIAPATAAPDPPQVKIITQEPVAVQQQSQVHESEPPTLAPKPQKPLKRESGLKPGHPRPEPFSDNAY